MSKLIDITGQTFGQLTVIERAENSPKGGARWVCKCTCGNLHTVVGTNLRGGIITRCPNCALKARTETQRKQHDITGQRYGKMTVIKRLDKQDKWQSFIYLCRCDCGNEFEASRGNIVGSNHKSCGLCNNRSNGEMKIEQILKDNNINFIKEQIFNDLILPSGKKARFDFYVDSKYLIEFDGQQHFESTGGSWFTEEYVEKIKQHDDIKNQYCKNHNIPLIRIPYWQYDDLCINDLKLETTTFLI